MSSSSRPAHPITHFISSLAAPLKPRSEITVDAAILLMVSPRHISHTKHQHTLENTQSNASWLQCVESSGFSLLYISGVCYHTHTVGNTSPCVKVCQRRYTRYHPGITSLTCCHSALKSKVTLWKVSAWLRVCVCLCSHLHTARAKRLILTDWPVKSRRVVGERGEEEQGWRM